MREAVLKPDRRSQRSQDAHLPDGSIYKQLGGGRLKKKKKKIFQKELMKLLLLQEKQSANVLVCGKA